MHKGKNLKVNLVLSTILASGLLTPQYSDARQERSFNKLPSIEINFEVLQELKIKEIAKAKRQAKQAAEETEIVETNPLQQPVSKANLKPIYKAKNAKPKPKIKTKPVSKPKVAKVEERKLPPRELPEKAKKQKAKSNIEKKIESILKSKEQKKKEVAKPENTELANKDQSGTVFMELPRNLPDEEAKKDTTEQAAKPTPTPQEPTAQIAETNIPPGYADKVASFFGNIPSLFSTSEKAEIAPPAAEIAQNDKAEPAPVKDLDEIAEINSDKPIEEPIKKPENLDGLEFTDELAWIKKKEEAPEKPSYLSVMDDNVQIILPNKIEKSTIGLAPTPQFRPIIKEKANIDIVANVHKPIEIVDKNVDVAEPIETKPVEQKIEVANVEDPATEEPAKEIDVEPAIPTPIKTNPNEMVDLARPITKALSDEEWQKELEAIRQRTIKTPEQPTDNVAQSETNDNIKTSEQPTEKTTISIAPSPTEPLAEKKSFLGSIKDWMPSFASKPEQQPLEPAKAVVANVPKNVPKIPEIKSPITKNEPVYLSDIVEGIRNTTPAEPAAVPEPVEVIAAIEEVIPEPIPTGTVEQTPAEVPTPEEVVPVQIVTKEAEPTKEVAEFELTSLPQKEVIEEVVVPQKARPQSTNLLNITFKANELDINEFDENRLSDFVQRVIPLKKTVKIVSYAPQGNDENNLSRRVSLKRAIAIRATMIDEGLSSMRINVQAMGVPDDEKKANSVNIFVVDGS